MMENIKISLDASGANGELSIVRVDGVIDTMTATELERVMNSLLHQKKYNIIIDLGGVDYISSAGWGIFISNIREIRQNNGDIKLAQMVPNVHEIFELLEFDSILQSFDKIDKAKRDFNLEDQPVEDLTGGRSEQSVVSKMAEAGTAVATSAPPTVEANAQFQPEGDEKTNDSFATDVESRVLDLVRDDPFLSVSEIKKVINSDQGFEKKVGWWQIRRILKKNDLLSKKKRFRYSRS
jgi:anti-sigma B factor antagonist